MITKTKTILVVEDNADDEALTLRALKKNNIQNEVIVTRDGAEALDYFFSRGKFEGRDASEQPQVVLLDLKLPKIDGLGVLKEIRKSSVTKLVPVVILTSSKKDKDLIESYILGVNSYIRKPVDFAAFMEAVKALGIYWLLLNEVPPSKPV